MGRPVTGPIDDTFSAEAMRHLFQQTPSPMMACCPRDDEPLVATMERAGAEFVCVVCGTWYGYMAPKPKPATAELETRAAAHREQYVRQREQRELDAAEAGE